MPPSTGSSGTTGSNPFGSMDSLMQMLFGGGQSNAQGLAPGQSSLYAPTDTTSASTLTGSGSDVAANPFGNITQNANGTVSQNPTSSAVPASTGTSGTSANLFSGFQQMIAPYLQELQGISTNATNANNQTQASLTNNLANTAQAAPPSAGVPQQQAQQDILQAVTGAVNGIGGGESYSSYWNNIQSQLTSMGFTPDMISSLQGRIAPGEAQSGNITDAGGGNSSTFISNDSSALDQFLNKYYASQPSAASSPGQSAVPGNPQAVSGGLSPQVSNPQPASQSVGIPGSTTQMTPSPGATTAANPFSTSLGSGTRNTLPMMPGGYKALSNV